MNSIVFTIVLAFVWILLFSLRREVRLEMFVLGIFAVVLVPSLLIFDDASGLLLAPLALIDYMVVFLGAGIAGTIYHVVFGQHYHKLPNVQFLRRSKNREKHISWFLELAVLLTILVWLSIAMQILLSIPVAIALLLSALLAGLYVATRRHDLLADALWSSFLMIFLVAFCVILARFFTVEGVVYPGLTSHFLLAASFTDILIWSVLAGVFLGPVYEYVRTLELR
jgi:hypothetical protein